MNVHYRSPDAGDKQLKLWRKLNEFADRHMELLDQTPHAEATAQMEIQKLNIERSGFMLAYLMEHGGNVEWFTKQKLKQETPVLDDQHRPMSLKRAMDIFDLHALSPDEEKALNIFLLNTLNDIGHLSDEAGRILQDVEFLDSEAMRAAFLRHNDVEVSRR